MDHGFRGLEPLLWKSLTVRISRLTFLPVEQDLNVNEERDDDPDRRVVVVDDGVVGEEGDQKDVEEDGNGLEAGCQPGFLT